MANDVTAVTIHRRNRATFRTTFLILPSFAPARPGRGPTQAESRAMMPAVGTAGKARLSFRGSSGTRLRRDGRQRKRNP